MLIIIAIVLFVAVLMLRETGIVVISITHRNIIYKNLKRIFFNMEEFICDIKKHLQFWLLQFVCQLAEKVLYRTIRTERIIGTLMEIQ